MATDRFGIDDSYHDARGVKHDLSRATRAALQAAMGIEPETAAPPRTSPTPCASCCRAATARWLPAPPTWYSKTAARARSDGALPEDLPFGYHRLYPRGGGETLLVVSPGRCHLPDDLRAWGFAAQLYAARSRSSWGIGDLADLARLARWTRSLGGDVLMVNPLTAPTPVTPIEPSPYYPSSRRYRNPLFLRIEDVPGWAGLPADVRERLDQRGDGAERRSPHRSRRDLPLKQEALEALFARFSRRRRLRLVLRRRGTGADRLRDLRGAGRAARQGLAALARGLQPPRRRRHRGLPRQRVPRASASTPGRSG